MRWSGGCPHSPPTAPSSILLRKMTFLCWLCLQLVFWANPSSYFRCVIFLGEVFICAVFKCVCLASFQIQNLKDVLSDLIPKEQSRIKSFKQQYGKTNIGQVTVDMVSSPLTLHQLHFFHRFSKVYLMLFSCDGVKKKTSLLTRKSRIVTDIIVLWWLFQVRFLQQYAFHSPMLFQIFKPQPRTLLLACI